MEETNPSLLPSAQRKVTMKKFSMAVGAAIALAGVTAPAQAQNLTWFGSTACFNTPNPSNRVAVSSNCSLNSSTSTSMWWDTNDNSGYRSSIDFDINSYNNGGASQNWPGGPASSSYDRSLAFGSVGATQKLYLGYFAFDRAYGDDLVSAYLSMRLTFDGGNVALTDRLLIEGVERNNNPDGVKISANNNPVAFSVNGYNYEFRYTGFDDYTNNNPSDDRYYCQNSNDNSLPATFTSDTQRKLCGEIKYLGSDSPNVQTTVPEPSTYALMGAGLLGIFGFARRRNRNA